MISTEEKSSQKKVDALVRNARNVAKCCVFPMILASAILVSSAGL